MEKKRHLRQCLGDQQPSRGIRWGHNLWTKFNEIQSNYAILQHECYKKKLEFSIAIRMVRYMPQPKKQGYSRARSWKPVALVSFIVATLGFYLVSRDTDDSATEFDAPVAEATDSTYPRELGSIQEFDRVGDANSSTPRSSAGADVDTAQNSPSNLIPDFMVHDVILLQAQQQIEFEQMQDDFDAVVTVGTGYSDTEVALRELRSLQAQQQSEAESAPDDEIVIAGGLDGSAALTVADLRALHNNQQSELESAGRPGDVVIAGSFDGSSEMTRVEIEALHSRERIALESDTSYENLYSAPLSTDGSSNLTVDELKELHDNQFQD
jgi:hypothetical protein